MFELVQAGKRCWYIEAPAKIGLVELGGGVVCLIDSGNDKDAGRKVLKHLEEKGWRLEAIYNTHSNADHIGGNRYLQGQTGCKIYAPGIEADFTRHPVLEPSFLYGGYPPKPLRHKFLLAQESDARPLAPEVLPEGMTSIPLPGHFFDMVGYAVDGEVVYLADCLSSRETLDKYKVGFLYDVAAYLETLEKTAGIKANTFIPAHAAVTSDIAPLAQYNIAAVKEVGETILGLCKGVSLDTILAQLFDYYGLTMTFEQYALVGSTVRSYLAWLLDGGRVEAVFEQNRLLWRKI